MVRVKFLESKQKKFLQDCLVSLNCPSLRELSRRLDMNYSSLKNYYCERRCLSLELFNELCSVSKINKKELKFEVLDENWGKVKGGKKSRKL